MVFFFPTLPSVFSYIKSWSHICVCTYTLFTQCLCYFHIHMYTYVCIKPLCNTSSLWKDSMSKWNSWPAPIPKKLGMPTGSPSQWGASADCMHLPGIVLREARLAWLCGHAAQSWLKLFVELELLDQNACLFPSVIGMATLLQWFYICTNYANVKSLPSPRHLTRWALSNSVISSKLMSECFKFNLHFS